MKKNERRLLIVSLVFPLYLFSLWFISKPFIGQLYFSDISEKRLLTAVYFDGWNATPHYLLGRYYYYRENPEVKKAIVYYRQSLRLSPLQGGCWLDLAKAYQTAGMRDEAGYAIERAVILIPKNPSVMWEAGVFHLINGNIEKSVKHFREFVLLKPERQEDAYDMLWKIPVDSRYLLLNLIPASYQYYKRYLLYLMSSERIRESGELWNTMKGTQVEDELLIRYLDFLISRRFYQEAEGIWAEYRERRFKEDDSGMNAPLWNGSFEYPILNGGFDWKISETKGVDVFVDRDVHILGDRSLGVTFDGMQNPDISVASQVVRVSPGRKYLLRGNIKSHAITTKNGLFLSVDGHDCKGLHKRSDIVTGTNFWREVSIEFEVPPECSMLTVKIRRERSDKLDNKISGSAWIDGIILVQK